MAASTEQKVDFLLKKLGYSSSKTGIAEDESSLSGTKKAPFAEPIPSPLVVPDSSVWSNSEHIPTTPPGSDTTYIKVYPASGSGWHMTEDTTVSGSRTFVARSTYNNNSTANLTNWIDTQFGPDYVIKVFKDDPTVPANELAAAGSGSNDTWFFDYSSGVLNFNGTQIPSGVNANNVYIVGYRYIGETGVLTPGDDVSFRNLSVTGVSTLTGNVTAQNNLTVVGNLTVNGDNTILNTSSLEVEDKNIGIASAASKLSDAQIDGAGITIYSANGDKTLTWDNSNSRMAFSHDLFAPNLNVSGNLNVTGDVVYDEVTGRNINISGVGTITHLNLTSLNVSTGATFTGNVNLGNDAFDQINVPGSFNTGLYPYGNIAVDLGNAGKYWRHLYVKNANIVGVSTFTGAIDLNADLDVDGHTNLDNVSIAGITTASSNVYIQKSGDAAFSLGSTNAGGATIVLDGDSNGDWSGNDYSSIRHDSNGNLVLKANSPGAANCYIQLGSAGDYGAMFKEGAESLLRYDNSTKIETTNTGAVITGICTATDFSGAAGGAADFPNGLTGTTGTFSGNVALLKAGRTNLKIGSSDASGAVIFLDGDSNGDVAGSDYAFIEHTSSGDLCFYGDNPNNDSELKFYTSDATTLALTLTGANATFAGTVTATSFVGGLPITNGADNRIITASSASALNAESALTFDGNQFYLSATTGRIEIRASNGSTEVTTARFHNAATADNRVLISCEANQGGDPYIKFDSGGTNFIVGQRWIGTTNNLLVMGAGENAQSISGLFIKNNGYLGINKNNPGQALDVLGHVEINGTTDGVINFNTTSSNGTFARFRKGNSTDTVMYVGASKGMISGSNSVNDGGVNAQQGIMYLNSAGGVFKFTTGAATSSGIDIVPRGSTGSSDSNNSTSPFIRFYDYPSGTYADTTTADDNNWAIGADDSGESKFKIICGGGGSSNLVTNISDSGQTGTTAIAFTSVGTGCKTEIRRIQTSEISDLSGTSAVGGTTVNKHYDASPAVGTYIVHGFIEYHDNAPSGDPDQCRMRLQVGGSTVTEVGILDEDSNNINRNDNNSFTAAIDVDGSTNVQVNVHTTDPSDPGGANYRYSIQIYKIG